MSCSGYGGQQCKTMDETKRVKVGPPEECLACMDSGHCLNGLYCFYMRRYVEHDSASMCDR